MEDIPAEMEINLPVPGECKSDSRGIQIVRQRASRGNRPSRAHQTDLWPSAAMSTAHRVKSC
jgi:hypothetical protein